MTDPKAHCRHYYRNIPTLAVGVPEPWWWAVLALGADVVNIHFSTDYRGPLAIVARPVQGIAYNLDCEAVCKILKAENKPQFDAYRSNKSAAGKIVGLVDVVACHGDAEADSLWWSGPFGLKVEKPCLLPLPNAPSMWSGDGSRFLEIPETKREGIKYALTRAAAGADPAYVSRY